MFIDNETKTSVLLCIGDKLNKDCIQEVFNQLKKIYKVPCVKFETDEKYYLKSQYYKYYSRMVSVFYEEEYDRYIKPLCDHMTENYLMEYTNGRGYSIGVRVINKRGKRCEMKSILRVRQEQKDFAKSYLKSVGINHVMCCPLLFEFK